jgi:hypothetical protein
MKFTVMLLALLCAVTLALPALAQEKLGKVTFPTSCDPKVQAKFERGVAALHSYWFTEARKSFEAVIQDDTSCAMAGWGLAVVYLGNTLVGPPPPKDLTAAWEAALREFETSIKENPELASKADTPRPEIARAKSFLGRP